MGQISAGLTWPVRTHRHTQVPWMTAMMSLVNTRNVTGSYRSGYGRHTKSVM